MVKISNGVRTMEVTRGAFDSIYKQQGYKKVEELANVASVVPVEPTDDEAFVTDVVARPLAQWNKDAVKRFAAIKGIDLEGTTNVNEAKARIKAFMDAE